MTNTLIYIFLFLYLIFVFSVTFYCYTGHLCCPHRREPKLTINYENEEIYPINNYEDDIF